MANELLLSDLVREVAPADAVAHAEANGWRRVSLARNDLAVFNDPEGTFRQVLVPFDPAGSDYAVRMMEAIMRFAERERRPAPEILNDLLLRGADVLRFRVAVPGQENGTLSPNDAARLYAGVRIALLAAARSVIEPQKVYSKL